MPRSRYASPVALAAAFSVVAPFAVTECRSISTVAAAPPQQAGPSAANVPPLLPTPPQQGAPWTPPTDEAARGLSDAFVAAIATLFTQGLADPRGGEYRAITVQVGSVWSGDGGIVETRGWVFPAQADGKRFAACWNGLVYPVIAVKGRANLQAQIGQAVKKSEDLLKKRGDRFGVFSFWDRGTPEATSLSAEYPSPLMAAYLLRLGENDLARRVLAVLDPKTTIDYNGAREARRDPYLQLATQWTWAAYDRAVCAHMRGADALAVADADLLTRASPLIEAEAVKRGYKTFSNGSIHEEGKPFLRFLHNLPALQQDALRRVAEAPRPPLDLKAIQARPQAERIALLIGRLDDVAARQSGQPGGVGLDADPISEALIAEGDAAIEPLLDVMEKDERLTRSVSFGRDFFQDRNLLPVKSAAWACFARITDVTQIGGATSSSGGGRSVGALRVWWAANKGASRADRWFTQLADDGQAAPPPAAPNESYEESNRRSREESERTHRNQSRWEEAAQRIAERGDIQRRGQWVNVPHRQSGQAPPPFKGESLRARRNPSVSELLARRARQVSEITPERSNFDARGANFALMLYEWDPNGRETLPALRELMRRCLADQNKRNKEEGRSDQGQVGGRIARLTIARLRLGDDIAAAEYGEWLRTVSPEFLGFESRSALLPLWMEAKNPAMRNIVDALFAEGGAAPPSAWSRLLTDPKARGNYHVTDLLASDLLRLPAFRALVMRRLSNTAEAGSVIQVGNDQRTRSFAWNEGSSQGPTPDKNARLRRQTLRLCDRTALALQPLLGVPIFDPLAPPAQRDKQCAAIAAYLARYGPTLGRPGRSEEGPAPLYSYDMGSAFDYLGPRFPARNRPATEADVRENRAVFTLNGGVTNTRVVFDLPVPLPFEAQWNKDPNAEFGTGMNNTIVRWSRGYIWQAEERFDGRNWVRYYGYVGPHSIAKVPASEIVIAK